MLEQTEGSLLSWISQTSEVSAIKYINTPLDTNVKIVMSTVREDSEYSECILLCAERLWKVFCEGKLCKLRTEGKVDYCEDYSK